MPVETTIPEDRATQTANRNTDGDASANAAGVPASVYRCPYCERPFTTRERVDLHVGLEHYDVCSDDEADAFEEAYLAENESLRIYRLKAAAAIIVLYFGLLMVYAVFT